MVAMVCSDSYDDVLQLWAGDEFLEHAEYVLELWSDVLLTGDYIIFISLLTLLPGAIILARVMIQMQ